MEPERKIEKLLRAYAQKRRSQAGEPLKLHPATRRLLQAEIARDARRPEEEEASLSLWELFRQRWAFLLGFALVVFFVATMFLPSLNRAKRKAQSATARYHLTEIGTAVRMYAEDNHQRLPASLDELTNELHLDLINTILTDPQNGRRFVYVGGGKNLDGLQSNSILAYSPTDKKGRAVLFADGRVEVIPGARFSELTNRGVSQLAAVNDFERRPSAGTPAGVTVAAGNAAAAPSVSGQLAAGKMGDTLRLKPAETGIAARGDADRSAKAAGISPEFTTGLQNRFTNTLTPVKAAPVLVQFEVQQSGNTLRIVDADGSVYTGAFLREGAGAPNEPAPATTPAPPGAAQSPVDQAKTAAKRDEPQTIQSHFFQVTGTNQTLKQNVAFAGELLAISSTTTYLPQSFKDSGGLSGGGGAGGRPQSGVTNSLPWSISRIAGTAVIAGTNQIEINAVPSAR